MYVENKDGEIDGPRARIGWVQFSKSGLSLRYRGRHLARAKGGGIRGNYLDVETGEEYWVSGVKRSGSNVHWAESVAVQIDDDARAEYSAVRTGGKRRRA
jgi:hypothetical protein